MLIVTPGSDRVPSIGYANVVVVVDVVFRMHLLRVKFRDGDEVFVDEQEDLEVSASDTDAGVVNGPAVTQGHLGNGRPCRSGPGSDARGPGVDRLDAILVVAGDQVVDPLPRDAASSGDLGLRETLVDNGQHDDSGNGHPQSSWSGHYQRCLDSCTNKVVNLDTLTSTYEAEPR